MYHRSQLLSVSLSLCGSYYVQVDHQAGFCTVSAGPGVAVWAWACGRRFQVISVVKNFNFKWKLLQNWLFFDWTGGNVSCLLLISDWWDEQRAETPRGPVWLARSGLVYFYTRVCPVSAPSALHYQRISTHFCSLVCHKHVAHTIPNILHRKLSDINPSETLHRT